MSSKKNNIYENLNMFEEIWERKDERKEEANKKMEKKQKYFTIIVQIPL